MFDISGEFKVKVVSEGDKLAIVTYPKDADWCARTRAITTVRKHISRSRSQYTPTDTDEFDFELFKKIRVDNGEEFDEVEAASVINRLDSTELISITREGDRMFEVKLKLYQLIRTSPDGDVFGRSLVTHRVRTPSAKASKKFFQESGSSPVFDGKKTESRTFLEPSIDLYDSLFIGVEGYAYPEGTEQNKIPRFIPINHKASVLSEIHIKMAELQSGEDIDPED